MAENTPVSRTFLKNTTTELADKIGKPGQMVADTAKNTLVLMDGTTPGGHPMAKESVKIKSASPNKLAVNGGVEGNLSGDITLTTVGSTVKIIDGSLDLNDEAAVAAAVSDIVVGDMVAYDCLGGCAGYIEHTGTQDVWIFVGKEYWTDDKIVEWFNKRYGGNNTIEQLRVGAPFRVVDNSVDSHWGPILEFMSLYLHIVPWMIVGPDGITCDKIFIGLPAVYIESYDWMDNKDTAGWVGDTPLNVATVNTLNFTNYHTFISGMTLKASYIYLLDTWIEFSNCRFKTAANIGDQHVWVSANYSASISLSTIEYSIEHSIGVFMRAARNSSLVHSGPIIYKGLPHVVDTFLSAWSSSYILPGITVTYEDMLSENVYRYGVSTGGLIELYGNNVPGSEKQYVITGGAVY